MPALTAVIVIMCAGVMSVRLPAYSGRLVPGTIATTQGNAMKMAVQAGIATGLEVSATVTHTSEIVKLVTGHERQRAAAHGVLSYSGQPAFVQVREQLVSIVERMPYEMQYRPEQSSVRGRVVVLRTGTGGVRQRVFRLTYEDGSLVSVVLVSDFRVEPAERDVIAVGTSVYRGGATKELYVEATAYTPTVQETDSDPWTTASGMKSGLGVVAVDPRVIPLGSKLYVEGYGYAIAGDTGGAIRGNRIDVFFYSHDEMVTWGRRWVRVFVLP
ncbi:MAG: 3D domain-containing protein [Candidatus Cryosericum sp.]